MPEESINQNLINSMVELFKTETFMQGHKFDVNRDSINCLNTELHWTGTGWNRKPHCRESFRTTQLPIEYDPAATAPRFETFLDEITQGDDDLQILICEMMGYCLLSHSKYEKFFMLIGPGANGKSVLLRVLMALLGAENVSGVSPVHLDRTFQRAHLLGKLANIVTELPEGALLPDEAMKAITSGEQMTAEMKFKPPFDFSPFATLVFATNHLPHTRDFSDALTRRAIIIPFDRTFAEEEQDRNLSIKLMEELPGILNLCLESIAGVFGRGCFIETASTVEFKNQWKLESDQAAQFVEDCCQRVPGHREEIKNLYSAYQTWAIDSGISRTLSRKMFTLRLKRLGATDARERNSRGLLGFKLNPQEMAWENSFYRS